METAEILEKSKTLTDEEVVDRVRAGDLAMYEVNMRRTTSASIASPAPSCTTTPRRKT